MSSETVDKMATKRAPRTGSHLSYYFTTVLIVAVLGLLIWGLNREPSMEVGDRQEKDNIPITDEFLFDREQLSKSQDKYTLYNNGQRVSYFWFLSQLSTNDVLRQSFIDTLNASRFETFRYESPPLSSALKDNDFEFILLDSPHLKGIKAELHTFAEHFDLAKTKGQVYAKFLNLGGSSTLIAPTPLNDEPAYRYSSIGPFIKKSSLVEEKNQVNEIMRQVAREGLSACEKSSKTYISTEGSGVYWLHVRFDPRPKYYSSQYRQL